MKKFLIAYVEPDTGEERERVLALFDDEDLPFLEMAKDYARTLSNDGWYEVSELH